MATLVDGLGNEELGDVSDTAQKTAQLNITGSVTATDVLVSGPTGTYRINTDTGATGALSGLTISGGIVVAIA